MIENETVAIIQRGATVDILTDLTCSFLYSHETNLDNYQVILVKLSAGLTNKLRLVRDFVRYDEPYNIILQYMR
jgi:hypothetical protein